MNNTLNQTIFDENATLQKLKHYLPQQLPLKDFVHHNLLHAFQNEHFYEANFKAKKIFGYKTYLTIHDYRELFHAEYIDEWILENVIAKYKGQRAIPEYKFRMLYDYVELDFRGKIGRIMHLWKDYYHVNVTKYVQPILFKIFGSYLDQGISNVRFPIEPNKSFLWNITELERNNYISLFFNKNGQARKWLLSEENICITTLLDKLVNNREWYEDYLFDLCFEHPGWSGIISVLEENPELNIHKRNISLKESLILELLLQYDYLQSKFKENFVPMNEKVSFPSDHLFDIGKRDERFELLEMWQESLEWSYYEKVMKGICVKLNSNSEEQNENISFSFQTIHCLDDREESFRRYLEYFAPDCETFGTAGFFNMDIFYQPNQSDYYLKLSPANMHPDILIREEKNVCEINKDIHLSSDSHSIFSSWIMSQTFGIISALKLGLHVFKPKMHPLVISAIQHSPIDSKLNFEFKGEYENNLKIGIPEFEAAEKLASLLKSIGLTKKFAPLVYIIAHGAGSSNNPYFAAYDCGACSGKPGSVNARVAAALLNKKNIRNLLKNHGIEIPEQTLFIAALHNTTSDNIYFFDTEILDEEHNELHKKNIEIFHKSLEWNAVERARRFETIVKKNLTNQQIHQKVKQREFALFIPRPEYNHATNAVCIIGKRSLTKGLFLDRRSFLNSYDYEQDLDGNLLSKILMALTNVCGGINLEYYYSRTDPEKLGSGSKLPHNVFGLIGVANGTDGDLRFGLPKQMTEIHWPLRLLMIVQHIPQTLEKIIKNSDSLKKWFDNQWIHLVALNPIDHVFYLYEPLGFKPYVFASNKPITEVGLPDLIKTTFRENIHDLPVFKLK